MLGKDTKGMRDAGGTAGIKNFMEVEVVDGLLRYKVGKRLVHTLSGAFPVAMLERVASTHVPYKHTFR